MAWEGKSQGQICAQLKDAKRNGGRDLALLHEHMAKDDLVAYGWQPGPGRDPVPGTQEAFGELIRAWIDTGAACPSPQVNDRNNRIARWLFDRGRSTMPKLRPASRTYTSPQTPRSVGGAARPMQKRLMEGTAVGRRKSPGRSNPRNRVYSKSLKIRPTVPSIIFDVEGTLVDCAFQVTESWQRALQDFGYPFSNVALHKYSGLDTDDMLRILLPDAGSEEKDSIKDAQGRTYREIFLPTVGAFPGVQSVLTKLRRAGHRIALATTCQRDELAVYFELTGAGEFVDVVACGDDKVRGKPHPDLFRLALGRLGVRKNALAVGDTPYDAIGAGRTGIRTIGTMSGGFSLRELEDAGCYAVVGRLQQLPEYIDVRTQLG